MTARIWIVLLAVLLLAAPADACVESIDVQASTSVCDGDAVAELVTPAAPITSGPASCAARHGDSVPPAPTLARVFRPPRPSFD